MFKLLLMLASAAMTVFASDAPMTMQALVAKHLATSRDFTVKVAEAMPAADFDFKLTAPQMSFGEQMVHLSQGMGYFLGSFSGEKPADAKPKSKSKEDVIAFIKTSFDDAIGKVSKLTPEQLAKTYKAEGASETGADLLLGMLDHTTHHRASAEMYLRAKGITPPEYQF